MATVSMHAYHGLRWCLYRTVTVSRLRHLLLLLLRRVQVPLQQRRGRALLHGQLLMSRPVLHAVMGKRLSKHVPCCAGCLVCDRRRSVAVLPQMALQGRPECAGLHRGRE